MRDYAIFLIDPEGIITYWGEGARLIKWWTRDQVEGAHFRVLYPDGGAEDGTAEGHLAEAARRGEMVSEGQRVRSDGSTFWAGATLTALRDAAGSLQGYAKLREAPRQPALRWPTCWTGGGPLAGLQNLLDQINGLLGGLLG